MRRHIVGLGLVLFVVTSVSAAAADPTLGVPNTSNKPPSGSPIQIEDCQAGQQGGLLVAQSNGNFRIAFTNEGAVVADLVRFQIDLGQEEIFIRDAGKFVPGVTITHTFRRRGGGVVSSPLLSPVKFSCQVAAVHFLDGTEWTLQAVAESGIAGSGWLGIALKQQADGVFVALVFPASPAQDAGIQQGDRLDAIESNHIGTIPDALQLISASPVGTKLHMTLNRGGTAVSVVATVGTRAASPSPRP